MSGKRNILFLNWVSHVGGAEKVLTSLAKRLINIYNIFIIVQEEGELTYFFREIGGSVYVLKLPGWRKVKNYLKRYFTIRKIVEFIEDNSIDLIHCNSYRLTPYCLYASKKTGVPFLTYVHDFIAEDKINKFLLSKSECLVVCSEYVKNCFKGMVKDNEVHKVYCGIEVDKFRFAQDGKFYNEFKIGKDKFLVGMIGNLIEKKRHKNFIKAASIVKQKLNNVKFVIVGDDVYGSGLSLEHLKDFAKKYNVLKDIIFTGYRKDIPNLLQDFGLFVFPSEYEALGLVVLESMASGTPVIINSNSGGTCEIIENGKDGIIVDCGDAEKLAKSIISLIKNKDLRESISLQAKDKVNRYFDIPIFVNRMKQIYQDMLNR